MKFDTAFNKQIASQVRTFLDLDRAEELTLTLDGFGVNSALNYLVLSLIGIDRLSRFKEINIISGSTYAWFCFQALHTGMLLPTERDLRSWDRIHLQLTGIRPCLSMFGIAVARVFRQKRFQIEARALAKTLEYLVSDDLASSKLSSLNFLLKFWLFDEI